MKKPDGYEIKKWLCSNVICGLKLYYYQTGSDTSATDWELESISGEKKRFRDYLVCRYIQFKPDWVSAFEVSKSVIDEVKAWDEYEAKESDELAEYERLKKKFES